MSGHGGGSTLKIIIKISGKTLTISAYLSLSIFYHDYQFNECKMKILLCRTQEIKYQRLFIDIESMMYYEINSNSKVITSEIITHTN